MDTLRDELTGMLAPAAPAGVPEPDRRDGRVPPARSERRSAEIVEILFERTMAMASRQGIRLVLTDAAKDALAAQGFDAAFGARPLKRVLQRQVANRLAEQILSGLVADGDAVVIDAADGGGVTLETVSAGEPVPGGTEMDGTETGTDGVADVPLAAGGEA